MNTILAKIISVIVAPVFILGGLLNPVHVAPDSAQSVGATLPQATGVFETSLASPITSTATSLTLTSNAVRGGGSISGYTCLTVDEGTAQAEVVCGTVSSTSMTGITRGISYADGTTSVSANKFSHRRGANVKITDFPLLQILKAQNNGDATYPNAVSYEGAVTCASSTQLCPKSYVDSVTIAGGVDASTLLKGISKLSVNPVSVSNPIAVGDNDTRVPTVNTSSLTAGQLQALSGTSGTPSSSNKYITDADTTGTGSVVRGSLIQSFHFGGDGSDGSLAISSGTTTIDCANAVVCIKNYTSISITGTGTLAFSNPNTNGTIIILRSQGNVTLTSSSAPMLNASGMGAAGGADTGSVSSNTNGTAGSDSNVYSYIKNTKGGAGSSSSTGSTGGSLTSGVITSAQNLILEKYSQILPGAGGGSGAYYQGTGYPAGTSGAGGRGGGGLIIECTGSWNFTTSGGISVAGTAGADAVGSNSTGIGSAQGGGGGGGGTLIAVYNALTANSGTVTISGGVGGGTTFHTATNGTSGAGGSGLGSSGSGAAYTGGSATAGGAGGNGYSIITSSNSL